MSSCEFWEILKNASLIEHLLWLLLTVDFNVIFLVAKGFSKKIQILE